MRDKYLIIFKILKNEFVFSVISKLILLVLGITSSIFINRYLGPSLKGEYAYTLNIINVLVLVLNFGLYQYYPKLKRNNSSDNITAKFINILLTQFFFYFIIAFLIWVIFIDSLTIIFIITLVPVMILTKQLTFILLVESPNKKNILNLTNEILYILILLAVYFFLSSQIIYMFILLYIKDGLSIFKSLKLLKVKFDLNLFDLKLLLDALKFGFLPMITVLLLTFNYNVDLFILERYVTFEQIGFYTVGVGLANKLWIIPDSFKEVLFSRSSKSDSIDNILLGIKINLYLLIGVLLLIFLVGKEVIVFLYGIEYESSYDITIIILFGIIPMIFFKLLNPLFLSNGMKNSIFFILLFSNIINVISNYIFIPDYGITGAAYSSVLSYTACGLVYLIIFVRKWNVKIIDLFLINRRELSRITLLFRKKAAVKE